MLTSISLATDKLQAGQGNSRLTATAYSSRDQLLKNCIDEMLFMDFIAGDSKGYALIAGKLKGRKISLVLRK